MKNFSQYIQHQSFNEMLHKIRKESMERILTFEPLIEKKLENVKSKRLKKTA